MNLFGTDLYRSFLAGFGITAIVLAVDILPQIGAI